MKYIAITLFVLVSLVACQSDTTKTDTSKLNLNGTWKLISGAVITNRVSVVTNYTKDQEMIKIINGTHFAFLKHPTTATPDSTNKFDAGGGKYELKGNQYTEHLDFYSDKKFQGTVYHFTVMMKGDTLIQQGKETAERSIMEKYIRLK